MEKKWTHLDVALGEDASAVHRVASSQSNGVIASLRTARSQSPVQQREAKSLQQRQRRQDQQQPHAEPRSSSHHHSPFCFMDVKSF